MKQLFDGIWSAFFKDETSLAQVAELLASVPIFEDLTKRELNLVSHILHERQYKAGELIFKEGEAGNGMYIIKKGVVSIFGTKEGHDVLYAELSDSQFFGELALVDGAPRSANARCSCESVLYGFFKPDLLELIEAKPDIGSKILWNLTSVLANRLRSTNEKVLEFQKSNLVKDSSSV
jgi:CRP/FNR family transcriptional regulator, cyclic AMP receptor protein